MTRLSAEEDGCCQSETTKFQSRMERGEEEWRIPSRASSWPELLSIEYTMEVAQFLANYFSLARLVPSVPSRVLTRGAMRMGLPTDGPSMDWTSRLRSRSYRSFTKVEPNGEAVPASQPAFGPYSSRTNVGSAHVFVRAARLLVVVLVAGREHVLRARVQLRSSGAQAIKQ